MAGAPRWPLIALGALGAVLTGCASTRPPQPARAAAHTLDPSRDWRRLPIAPLGSLLQDVPVPLHEVLMFGERSAQECYAPDVPPGHFIGREIESYLLCFARGRLDRVELTMNLPAADAEAEFSRYCGDWQTGTVPVSPRTAASCSGTAAQGLSFNASLGESPQDDGDGAVLLSIVVSETPLPDSR